MALTRVQATAKIYYTGTTHILGMSTLPTVGNGLIVLINGWRSGASSALPTTCTDNRGNTYTLVGTRSNSNAVTGVFVCAKVIASAAPFNLTVTCSLALDSVHQVIEVSGVGAGLAVDQSVGATGSSTTPATGAAPALTAAETFQVAIHSIASSQGSITIGASTPTWTDEFEELSSGYIAGEAVSRLVSSGAGTTPSASWTDITAAVWSAMLVAFSGGAGAGAVFGATCASTLVVRVPTVALPPVRTVTLPTRASTTVLYPVTLGNAVPIAVSQLVVETLAVLPGSPVAVTQVAAEILFIGTPVNESRVTDLACELIIVPRQVEELCPVSLFPIDADE
jgi:hypothetical protein